MSAAEKTVVSSSASSRSHTMTKAAQSSKSLERDDLPSSTGDTAQEPNDKVMKVAPIDPRPDTLSLSKTRI